MSQDTTMTQGEAASFLGVTDRTVRNYIKKGLLSKTRVGGKTRIPSEEVITLKEDLDSINPVVSRKEMLKLRSKVRRLESHMEVVLRMLDAKDAALSLSPAYSEELYALCMQHGKKKEWLVAEITPWCDIFERVSEDDFFVMSEKTSDPHPWRPFLRLCTSMIAYLVGRQDYRTSLEIQTLHRTLSGARRKLRISAFIYGETRGDVQTELGGFVVPASTTETLFRKVLKNT